MKLGLFYEHQLPRPWEDGSELTLIQDALEQVELADRLGFDVVWEVEHHFLEEYSHSSAPEVFLGAAMARRTSAPPDLPEGYSVPAIPRKMVDRSGSAEAKQWLDELAGSAAAGQSPTPF